MSTTEQIEKAEAFDEIVEYANSLFSSGTTGTVVDWFKEFLDELKARRQKDKELRNEPEADETFIIADVFGKHRCGYDGIDAYKYDPACEICNPPGYIQQSICECGHEFHFLNHSKRTFCINVDCDCPRFRPRLTNPVEQNWYVFGNGDGSFYEKGFGELSVTYPDQEAIDKWFAGLKRVGSGIVTCVCGSHFVFASIDGGVIKRKESWKREHFPCQFQLSEEEPMDLSFVR